MLRDELIRKLNKFIEVKELAEHMGFFEFANSLSKTIIQLRFQLGIKNLLEEEGLQ